MTVTTISRLDKRARLVESAAKLVHQQGFNRTTLADIAQDAAVPLGNVYYYFKTKEALGEALIERHAERYRMLRADWDRYPDPRDRIESFVQMVFNNRDTLMRSGCPVGTLCGELHKDGGPLAGRATALFAEWLSWLETQFRAIGKEEESPDLAAYLLSTMQGATMLSHSFRSPDYIVRAAERLKGWIQTV